MHSPCTCQDTRGHQVAPAVQHTTVQDSTGGGLFGHFDSAILSNVAIVNPMHAVDILVQLQSADLDVTFIHEAVLKDYSSMGHDRWHVESLLV